MPIEATASTKSTATGRSASCSVVLWPKIETSGPNGITAKARNAGIAGDDRGER